MPSEQKRSGQLEMTHTPMHLSILWNAVTSPETLLNAYSVKIMLGL